MFSKTHNLLFFTMMTNMNPTKTQRRPQNTSKRAPKRTGSTQKTEENPKYHESTPKVPLSLPEVLQNPQFTLFQHDDHGKPNETQWRPQNTSKTPQTRTESEEKTTKTKKFPRKPPETHLIFSKTHNPHPFTLRKSRTQQNPTETPKHVKNFPNKNRITPKK